MTEKALVQKNTLEIAALVVLYEPCIVSTGNNPSRANPDDARLTERNALRGELLYGANMNIERNTRETLGIGIWWTFTILAFTILATVTLLGPQAF